MQRVLMMPELCLQTNRTMRGKLPKLQPLSAGVGETAAPPSEGGAFPP